MVILVRIMITAYLQGKWLQDKNHHCNVCYNSNQDYDIITRIMIVSNILILRKKNNVSVRRYCEWNRNIGVNNQMEHSEAGH
jgi:hypothetical protein